MRQLVTTPENFKHRCVQDLAWTIQSPAIISGIYNNSHWLSSSWWQNEYQACLPGLLALDHDPTPLKRTLSQLKTKRLGERFECFVEHWLSLSPNYQCLTKNLALRMNKQTLGEVDFIIQEIATGKIIHLEVAIKFYLGIDDLNLTRNWHGPNRKDRLDIKLNNLISHQTQLSKKYPDLIPYPIDESWCMIKGRMFYPPGLQPNSRLFDEKHLNSHWYNNLQMIKHTGDIYPVEKINWLAQLSALPENINTMSSVIEQPVCCVDYRNQQEKRRVFLVPAKHWEKEY
jgi:hypothetical protein